MFKVLSILKIIIQGLCLENAKKQQNELTQLLLNAILENNYGSFSYCVFVVWR